MTAGSSGTHALSGLILGLRPANERRRYFVTASLIRWAKTYNQTCSIDDLLHMCILYFDSLCRLWKGLWQWNMHPCHFVVRWSNPLFWLLRRDLLQYVLYLLTHVPPDKMAAISQTIFSDALSWMKSFVFWLKFHWSLFLRVQLTIFQHWFR